MVSSHKDRALLRVTLGIGALLLIVCGGLLMRAGLIRAEAGASVFFDPTSATVPVDALLDLDIGVSDVVGLQALQMEITFNPAVLQVVDADPVLTGVQIVPGDIFPQDTPLFNIASNVLGTCEYSIVRFASLPFSGDGTIATIPFQAIAVGSSPITITALIMQDGVGDIPVTVSGATINVVAAGDETPTATATHTAAPTATETASPSPTATATPTPIETLPTIDPAPSATLESGLVLRLPLIYASQPAVPTMTPPPKMTATPSLTPQLSPTPSHTATATPTASPTASITPTPSVTPTPGACNQVIINGSAEQNVAWHFPVTAWTGGYSTTRSRTGWRSLRTGIESGPPVFSYSSAEQAFFVPLDTISGRLSFWYYAVALGPNYDGDRSYVLLLDDSGEYEIVLTLIWPETNTQRWTEVVIEDIDWTKYRGQQVRLRFLTINNAYLETAVMYTDDVSLLLCR